MFIEWYWLGPIMIVTLVMLLLLLVRVASLQHERVSLYEWLHDDSKEVSEYRMSLTEAMQVIEADQRERRVLDTAVDTLAEAILIDNPIETKPHVKVLLIHRAKQGELDVVRGFVG